jgi:hypothetical protein
MMSSEGQLRTYVEAAIHRDIGDATVDYADCDGSPELVIRPHSRPARGNRSPGVSDS